MAFKYLITGGTGFIGKHLIKALLRNEQNKLIIIDNLSNSTIEDYKEFLSGSITTERLSFYRDDIRDAKAVNEIFKYEETIDVCIHLAAKISVQKSINAPDETLDVNVGGTQSVLSASTAANIRRFIYASSAAVYGKPHSLPLFEEDVLKPISPYGASKVLGEQAVFRYSKKIPLTMCLRFFNVYGAGQTPEYAGVITKFASRILNGQPPIIYGDGKQTRDFVSVNDIIRSILLAVSYGTNNPGNRTDEKLNKNDVVVNHSYINVGTGRPHTLLEVLKILQDILKKHPVEPIHDRPRDGDIQDSYASVKKAVQELSYKARDDLRSGLERMFV